MNQMQPLTETVRGIDPSKIELPVLRSLVRDIQEKSASEIRQEAQHWNDTNWNQWRQHSSHNPW